jgi:hypothetical protein
MKTAISIDDNIFSDAELATQILGISRSALYTEALKEYLIHHLPDNITASYNNFYGSKEAKDEEIDRIALDVLSQVEWDD